MDSFSYDLYWKICLLKLMLTNIPNSRVDRFLIGLRWPLSGKIARRSI